jgi:predicted nucleic acid-binding protein
MVMAQHRIIADTGPLVAFLNKNDHHHSWARAEFSKLSFPLTTCEAVISEAVFLLHSDRLSSDPLFEAITRGMITVSFSLQNHWPEVRNLVSKYYDLPMSLADACLVRMSELSPESEILTNDRHFRIYRKLGRQEIALRCPFQSLH